MKPRLVAVSKTKPNELLIAAYEAGQRHFGENYIQEMNQKGNDPEVAYLYRG
jgi:PLP dependent protein